MCGIVGYAGGSAAVPILLDGLSQLEYRGYDSAGISVFGPDGLLTVKAEGRLDNLRAKLTEIPEGCCGIGHTRWATHGAPSDVNAHPHRSNKVVIIHNGIIENYLAIKTFLLEKGYMFVSQTDTEVAAALIDFHYTGDPFTAIKKFLEEIEGSYSLGIMFSDRPGEIYAVRKDGPLLVAVGEGENFIVSDVTAVIGHTKKFFPLEEGEIAVITQDSAKVYDLMHRLVHKELLTVTWNIEEAQKDGFDHFMMKEITEQPTAIHNTISPRIKQGQPTFGFDGIPEGFFKAFDHINIVACGTAMHAGLVGKSVIEDLARVHVEVDIASEFRYKNPILDDKSLVIIISQSGETADSLAALRLARSSGITTLAIVNVAGSSIAREADFVIHTLAGPEISVASTKAFTVQLAILYLIAFTMGREKGMLTDSASLELTNLLGKVQKVMKIQLLKNKEIQETAKNFKETEHLFFIGRGLDYSLASEGSLKLKEISYIYSEAYAAGELKHGTISLITPGVPVIGLCTQQKLIPKLVSNLQEVRARGAYTLLIASAGYKADPDLYDSLITLEELPDLFMPFILAVTLQLLAYHTAALRGCDIDKPRNLAKSVTVE